MGNDRGVPPLDFSTKELDTQAVCSWKSGPSSGRWGSCLIQNFHTLSWRGELPWALATSRSAACTYLHNEDVEAGWGSAWTLNYCLFHVIRLLSSRKRLDLRQSLYLPAWAKQAAHAWDGRELFCIFRKWVGVPLSLLVSGPGSPPPSLMCGAWGGGAEMSLKRSDREQRRRKSNVLPAPSCSWESVSLFPALSRCLLSHAPLLSCLRSDYLPVSLRGLPSACHPAAGGPQVGSLQPHRRVDHRLSLPRPAARRPLPSVRIPRILGARESPSSVRHLIQGPQRLREPH